MRGTSRALSVMYHSFQVFRAARCPAVVILQSFPLRRCTTTTARYTMELRKQVKCTSVACHILSCSAGDRSLRLHAALCSHPAKRTFEAMHRHYSLLHYGPQEAGKGHLYSASCHVLLVTGL